jgi:sugar/nucleoside kinase (ribokinase family)
MFSVLSIGDLVADLVFQIPQLPVVHEEHQHARSVTVEAGGAGNFLIAGARLGMRMGALGTLGTDAFGDAVQSILRAEGVDLSGVVRAPGSTTTPVLVLIDEQRQHVYIGGKQQGPSLMLTDAWRTQIAQAHALYISGFTLLEPQMTAVVQPLLTYAQQQGVPVFFDPGPFGAEIAWAQRSAVLATSRVLLLTESEIALFVSGSPYAEQPNELWRSFLQNAERQICIKRGGQGCRIMTQGQTSEHPGFAVAVLDTTAAGDTFAAAYIYAYLQGWAAAQIATFANAVGAAKVQKIGSGRQTPTLDEVQAVLTQFGVQLPGT